ncbi:MAG: hypothetical protein R2747_13590 [Pyrinomonadaceae bacterium]
MKPKPSKGKIKNRPGSIGNGFLNNHSIHENGVNQRLDVSDFIKKLARLQCRNCGFDYLRFAVDAVTIDCLQGVVVREFPQFRSKWGKTGGRHV